ncbi:PilZ domain-containing protein [Sphingomonas sp. Sphisp140]|uniref:PilZ domain-containing protein n=1 Tax=unclassified Sphingomonas TaxID=196159 RepID=UPI0039B0E061
MRQGLASSTIFSLSGEAPAAQLLPEPGDHAAFDAAVLVGETTRLACSIRKLSAAGAMLQIDDEIVEAEGLHLELANGQSLAGRIGWTEQGSAGFLFETPIDVISTLARNLAALPAERRSVPRVELHQTICVRRGNQVEFTRSRNLSQGGCGFETDIALQEGDAVQINFDGLRPLDGLVKWSQGSFAGVAFDEDLPWQVLMPWLRQAQQQPSHHTRIAVIQEQNGLIPDQKAIRLDTPARVREGVRWWNVKLRGITPQLVEFESRAPFANGAQLWISLPNIGGGPASVIETDDRHRFLCEFRLPLKAGDLGRISG